jgi:hypothetical protein
MLSIEAEAPATIYEVEEVRDSEEDDSVGLVKDVGDDDSRDDAAPPKPLRQITLIELFHPL